MLPKRITLLALNHIKHPIFRCFSHLFFLHNYGSICCYLPPLLWGFYYLWHVYLSWFICFFVKQQNKFSTINAEPILPNKFVYLYGEKNNTGPWSGAAALYGVTPWMKNNVDKDYPTRIKTRWFADKFPNLSAWEIESILCIYRKHFTFNMPY